MLTFECFRLTKDTCRVLIDEIISFMPEKKRQTGISDELQVNNIFQ